MCGHQKKEYFPNSIAFLPCLVSCIEQFPLAVQIILQKKQMLQVLREFLKCKEILVNSQTLDVGEKAKACGNHKD